jgi:YhcH/YjgK/YiaL family protein
MIYDQLKNSSVYRNLLPGLAQAFDYLHSFRPGTPDGKYPLDGDHVYALVQSYPSAPASGKKFESHQRYVDLQYMVSGQEIIQYIPLHLLKITDPCTAKNDCTLYELADTNATPTPLLMNAGDFSVLFPADGHKPGCSVAQPVPVKKIVLKIAL